MPKMPVDFAGPSYFGGKDDQLVLCAGKGEYLPVLGYSFAHAHGPFVFAGGDIHIWERESGVLMHHVRAQDSDGDLTCIAWNHAAVPFMFSTGSHDGAVRIWTTPGGNTTGPQNQRREEDDQEQMLGTDTLRSDTPPPFSLDPLERTDSPTTQDEFESLDEHTQSGEGPGLSTGEETERLPSITFYDAAARFRGRG